MARAWARSELIKFKELWESERNIDIILSNFPGRTKQSLRLLASRKNIKRLVNPSFWVPGKISIEEINLSYLAGYLDADGCIGIYKNNKDKNIYPRISYVSTDLNILQWIYGQIKFGGINVHKNNPNTQKISYSLQLNSMEKISSFLMTIIPYLHLKKDRASGVLDFIIYKMNKPRATTGLDEIEIGLYNKLRELNHKGP